MTPTCANPRALPPPNATPIVRRCVGAAGCANATEVSRPNETKSASAAARRGDDIVYGDRLARRSRGVAYGGRLEPRERSRATGQDAFHSRRRAGGGGRRGIRTARAARSLVSRQQRRSLRPPP